MKRNKNISHQVAEQIGLTNLFMEKLGLEISDADTLGHALIDISISWQTIYNELIPKLKKLSDRDEIMDLMFEIREEFRHVDYHIKDAALDKLNYLNSKLK